MNELLIRRLLGALVLLALAFVVASLLPDPAVGDKSVGVAEQVVRYDLQTGQALGLKLEPRLQGSPSVAEAASEPAPTAAAPQADAASAASAAPVVPEVREPVAPAPVVASGWIVQIGSFSDPTNARAVRDRLVSGKLGGSVQEVRVGKALWYRVRVGPFSRESAANDALKQVKALGYRDARVLTDPGS